ncbi:MAG TPA: macrolide family glycosyltransferase [Pilimelia sp.]|nr:macrolide family glycosyltransferase [Pilimelia sp.]
MRQHIAFVSIPSIGHVYPTLAVVAELVRRGHRVSYASVRSRAPVIEAAGARLVPYESRLAADSDRDLVLPDRADFLGRIWLTFLDEAETVLPQLEAAYATDPPDLVVYDAMAFAGRVLAAGRRLPSVQLRTGLLSNEHWSLAALAGFDPAHPAYLAYLARLDALLTRHGVPMSPEEFRNPPGQRQIVFLPRAFQYRGDSFDRRFSFVGPCIRPDPDPSRWRRPPGRPVLLATLGTVYNRHPAFYRACFAAFAGSPWHVVLAVGERTDPAELGPAPDNVEVHRVVPQLAVLAQASAFLSHAGMGGLMEAIRAGVPQVAVPQTLEQEANAQRLVELGLGVRLGAAGLTPAGVRAAVDRVADDPIVVGRIAAMRQEIFTAGGAPRAADVVEASLRGRFRPPRQRVAAERLTPPGPAETLLR